MGGEFADETDGVGEEEGEVVDDDLSDGSVEGGEELVFGEYVALAEEVHEGGFADVGVSDKGNAGELATVFALDRLLSVDLAEFLLEAGDFVEDNAPVGLDLSLTGATHADTAALSLEVGPHAGEAREEVLVLSELDLGLSVGGLGATSENVEDEACAVEDLDLKLALDVEDLLGREVVVEDSHLDVVVFDILTDLVELTGTDVCA